MIDKACIFNIQKFSIHDGPGIRSVVFFKGCPLRCFWCANPESQSGIPEEMWDNQKKKNTIVGNYRTIDEIVDEVMKDEPFYLESDGGVTFSGGEVLYQAEFATELAKVLKSKGVHLATETTGFGKKNAFKEYIAQMDLIYFDVKHYDPMKHKEGIGVDNKLILENLRYAVKNHSNLVVRIPIIPNYNDSLEDAENFVKLFKEIGITELELLPFHQFGEKKYEYLNRDYQMQDIPQLHTEDLLAHQQIFINAGIDCKVR